MLLQPEQMHKMISISLKMVEVVIWKKLVVILSSAHFETTVILTQLEISHVLNGTTPEIQHRKWEPNTQVQQDRNIRLNP